MISIQVIVIAVTVLLADGVKLESRISNGHNARSQGNFPHHVVIGKCGGCIIHEYWILTTKTCIDQNLERRYGQNLELDFQRLYKNVNVFSLTINVTKESVATHPFSNIALIKLPVSLQLIGDLQKIDLVTEHDLDLESDIFGVVPGFDDYSNGELEFGIYQLNPTKCKDKPTQICTIAYHGYPKSVLCNNDIGSGLVADWTGKPSLVGVLSKPTCELGYEIFTKIGPFIPWIETITNLSFSRNVTQTTVDVTDSTTSPSTTTPTKYDI